MTNPLAILLPFTIVVPLVFSLLALIRPVRRILCLSAVVFTFYVALRVFLLTRHAPLTFEIFSINGFSFSLYADALGSFITMSCSFFALLLTLYSPTIVDTYPGGRFYYSLILATLTAANGAGLAHNILLLVFFWGFLGASLYVLMMISRRDYAAAAQKAFIIVGVSDVLLILGFILLFVQFGISTTTIEQPLAIDSPLILVTFILIMIGALAKAGSMPFHSWIPDAATVAPASTMAFIPASLDKLLGIYLLVRFSCYVFDVPHSMPVRLLLLVIGSITIVAAVMMAMIQKEALKLLSFHAVSQVGYMVLGVGTGTAVGIAGGLFHMLNHALYKACLFMSAGSVEHQAKTTVLEKLGGLGTKMPLTFFAFFVAALAISGVPPLNGFYSKWMVYQGIIELAQDIPLWPFFLIAAMFGSVLTLASFLKMIHSLFLGERPKNLHRVKENNAWVVIPITLLALICIVFGIFATQVPLAHLIYPSLPFHVTRSGFWTPALATVLIIIGLFIGLIVFLMGTAIKARTTPVFVGGEILQGEEARIPGTEFYSSVKSTGFLPVLFEKAEAGFFDLYNVLSKCVQGFASLVFVYVDRVIDRLMDVIAELSRFLSSTLQSLSTWFFFVALIPFLAYAATGSVSYLRTCALMLLFAGPLIALAEDNITVFVIAITVGQCGLVFLSMCSGQNMGNVVSLFQIAASLVALMVVYISTKTITELTGKYRIQDMQGLANNTATIAVGFIVGGLMLSALPPSANFVSKFMTTSLFEGDAVVLYSVSGAALLNLAAFLRVARKVFLGPATITKRKKFGSEELSIIVLIIANLILVWRAHDFIELLRITWRIQ